MLRTLLILAVIALAAQSASTLSTARKYQHFEQKNSQIGLAVGCTGSKANCKDPPQTPKKDEKKDEKKPSDAPATTPDKKDEDKKKEDAKSKENEAKKAPTTPDAKNGKTEQPGQNPPNAGAGKPEGSQGAALTSPGQNAGSEDQQFRVMEGKIQELENLVHQLADKFSKTMGKVLGQNSPLVHAFKQGRLGNPAGFPQNSNDPTDPTQNSNDPNYPQNDEFGFPRDPSIPPQQNLDAAGNPTLPQPRNTPNGYEIPVLVINPKKLQKYIQARNGRRDQPDEAPGALGANPDDPYDEDVSRFPNGPNRRLSRSRMLRSSRKSHQFGLEDDPARRKGPHDLEDEDPREGAKNGEDGRDRGEGTHLICYRKEVRRRRPGGVVNYVEEDDDDAPGPDRRSKMLKTLAGLASSSRAEKSA